MSFPNTTQLSLTLISRGNTNVSFGMGQFMLTNFSLMSTPIISDAAMQNINIYVNILICGSVAIFGTVNNVINIIIFYRLGLKDSMSVGLLMLSFTDFLHNLLIVVSRGFSIWDTFFLPVAYDPLAINYICFDWIRDILYLSSGWITTCLSIERCVCVVFPFKVRQIFTRARCLGVIIGIYVTHVALYMPVFVTQRLGWSKVTMGDAGSDSSNGSVSSPVVTIDRLVAVFSEFRPQVDAYVDYADGFPFISQFIVLTSVVWMIHGLRMSSKMRRAMAVVVVVNDRTSHEQRNDEDESSNAKSRRGHSSDMSQKNKRLMKVVLFLAIILIVCNTPRFIAAYARHVHAQVVFGKEDFNLFLFLWTLAILFTVINTSVNIFVYLIINSSYRAHFKRMFRPGEKE